MVLLLIQRCGTIERLIVIYNGYTTCYIYFRERSGHFRSQYADMDLINEIEANGYLAKDDVTNPEADIIEEGALVLTVDGERIVVAEEDLTRGNI
jgi:hypothetical protein